MSWRSLLDGLRLWARFRFSPGALRDLRRVGRLAEGVLGARTLTAARELGLFGALGEGGATTSELARRLGVPGPALRVLLDSCLHFGLLKRRGERLVPASLVTRLLDGPGGLGPALEGLVSSTLRAAPSAVARIRDGRAPRGFYEGMERADPDGIREYARFLDAAAEGPSRVLAGAADLAGARSLLDVGGGLGRFSQAFTARFPDLRATVAELPAVCPLAEEALRARGAARVSVLPLDFRKDPLPAGHDAVLFARVLHDWDQDTVRRLLREAHRVLTGAGRLLVFEILRDRDLGNGAAVVLAQWEVLLGSSGEIRTEGDYRTLLAEAGFQDVQLARPFDPLGRNALVTARRV
ncbi:MAG: acetylserotonin O-methyltransferase [Planctomycetales bacterium]|nr:acetylserotonin O-methyltransferase [Planctomycetales bacterium]